MRLEEPGGTGIAIVIERHDHVGRELVRLVKTVGTNAIRAAREDPRMSPELLVDLLPRAMNQVRGLELERPFRVILHHDEVMTLELPTPGVQKSRDASLPCRRNDDCCFHRSRLLVRPRA